MIPIYRGFICQGNLSFTFPPFLHPLIQQERSGGSEQEKEEDRDPGAEINLN